MFLVNDGSTDDSGEIAQQYEKKYPHIFKYLVKENGGLSDARNFAIPYVHNDYVFFIDSDDYVDETYLEIDHDIEQESSVIQVKLKKDGSPYNNAKIISHDELNTLLQEITLHIQGLYQQMISGDIRIYPTRSDNPTIDMHINPCRFCHYKAICNYDIFYNEDHQIELGGKNEER